MFGIGPEEIMVVGLLCLVLFGPRKLSSMARDLGRFTREARRPIDELKEELSMTAEEEPVPKEKESTRVKESQPSQLKEG
jgi:TatA/E family protein of Tat protein translocase